MQKKIDKRLEEALNSGLKKKYADQQKEADKKRAVREAHMKEVSKHLPKARKWVKERLFKMIEKAESEGYQTITLNEWTDNIPTEAIYQVVSKIDGLRIYSQNDVVWEDSDYGKAYALQYHIEWKSKDPNLNRSY